jgi:hypothetical protein
MKSLAKVAWLSLFTLWFGFGEVAESNAYVLREGHRVFIVDRTGENWDVAQAAALGFDPRGFQFGIGRDSIQALHDTDLDDRTPMMNSQVRFIGVENGPDVHACVVRKLTGTKLPIRYLEKSPSPPPTDRW